VVIDTGKNRVLLDTGADGLDPNTGKLLRNLQAEGITPGEIDTVILTHGHPDHIGGNTVSEGRPAFPNARFVMWKDEWDFWTSDLEELKGEEHVKELLVSFARRNLPPIQGQLYLVDHETEIVPGIQALAAPGHTPGHMAVIISSNRAAVALRLAAQSLYNSHSALGAFLRRQKARLGAPKVITATAHKVARLVYTLLKHGTEYVDAGQDYYEEQYRQRVIYNLKRRAKQMGFCLVEKETGAIA